MELLFALSWSVWRVARQAGLGFTENSPKRRNPVSGSCGVKCFAGVRRMGRLVRLDKAKFWRIVYKSICLSGCLHYHPPLQMWSLDHVQPSYQGPGTLPYWMPTAHLRPHLVWSCSSDWSTCQDQLQKYRGHDHPVPTALARACNPDASRPTAPQSSVWPVTPRSAPGRGAQEEVQGPAEDLFEEV